MNKNMLLAFVLLAPISCSFTTPPESPEEVSPLSLEPCTAACARLVELNCEEGFPDEEGNECVDVCVSTQEEGLIDLQPELISESDSCP